MKWFIFAISLLPLRARGFPDMVRHGYTHCISCHVQVAGGGLLNEYGRSLSRELLSQPTLTGFASSETDEKFLYGILKSPEWLALGGDVRLLQTFVESKEASKGRFMLMQVDLDASAKMNRWRAFASIGRVEPLESDPIAKDFVISPRHWLEYSFTSPESENRIAARAGRFMPAYGIGFAEHTFVTRRVLGFQPGQERYGYELSWENEHSSVIAAGIVSRGEGSGVRDEKGGALQATTAVGEKSKVGLSYFQSQRNEGSLFTLRMHGAFAHLAFDKDWYALIEVDRVKSQSEKWGFLDVFKLGYEIEQGLHLVGVHEFANLNMEESNPRFEAYSVGVEWFPRTHWDLYLMYRKERDTALSNNYQDVVWMIGHFYL